MDCQATDSRSARSTWSDRLQSKQACRRMEQGEEHGHQDDEDTCGRVRAECHRANVVVCKERYCKGVSLFRS